MTWAIASLTVEAVVVAYLFSAEISTYELIFLHKSPASSQSLSFDHKRIDYLAALLKACQNCAEYFLALDLTTSTAPTQLVFSHSIKILHRLVILRDPVWNDEMLVSSVNVPELLYRCAMAAEQANERLKARTGEDSVFTDAARDIREMIPKWLVPNRDQVSPRPDAVPNWQAEQEHSLAIDIFSEEFWMDQPFTF